MTTRPGGRRRGPARRAAVAAFLALLLLVARGARTAEPSADPTAMALQADLLGKARSLLAEAERRGAGKLLPRWRAASVAAIAGAAARIVADPDAARAGACADAVRAAEESAALLVGTTRFVQELRRQKPDWQAVADAWDRDLRAAASAAGVGLAPTAAGTELARALVDSLGRRRLRWQGQADSLNAGHRRERELLQLDLAERDSALAGLRRQLSDVQQTLWDLELRAGVADADRTAVEARLRAEREHADLVRGVAEAFASAGGEAVLDAAGALVLRHPGLAFAPGLTEVTPEMDDALAAAARAVSAFPGGRARVEGHTDNSGGRAANLKLAQARAEAVAQALRARLDRGAAVEVTAVGVGPDRPLVSNATTAGREKNRRIEIVVSRAGGAP